MDSNHHTSHPVDGRSTRRLRCVFGRLPGYLVPATLACGLFAFAVLHSPELHPGGNHSGFWLTAASRSNPTFRRAKTTETGHPPGAQTARCIEKVAATTPPGLYRSSGWAERAQEAGRRLNQPDSQQARSRSPIVVPTPDGVALDRKPCMQDNDLSCLANTCQITLRSINLFS